MKIYFYIFFKTNQLIRIHCFIRTSYFIFLHKYPFFFSYTEWSIISLQPTAVSGSLVAALLQDSAVPPWALSSYVVLMTRYILSSLPCLLPLSLPTAAEGLYRAVWAQAINLHFQQFQVLLSCQVVTHALC